jgi:hypothetical protein
LDPKFPGDPGRRLEIKVGYSKGGLSVFTYKTDPRGYSLYVQPVIIEVSPFGTSRQYRPFGPVSESGLRFFVEGASRLNRKRLAALVEAIAPRADEIAAAFRREDYPFIRALVASVSKNFGAVAV